MHSLLKHGSTLRYCFVAVLLLSNAIFVNQSAAGLLYYTGNPTVFGGGGPITGEIEISKVFGEGDLLTLADVSSFRFYWEGLTWTSDKANVLTFLVLVGEDLIPSHWEIQLEQNIYLYWPGVEDLVTSTSGIGNWGTFDSVVEMDLGVGSILGSVFGDQHLTTNNQGSWVFVPVPSSYTLVLLALVFGYFHRFNQFGSATKCRLSPMIGQNENT